MIVKTECMHLFNGLLHRPMIFRDAVGGNHHAGAVAAIPAVDENLLSLGVTDERKKLSDLFVGWGRPAADRNVDESKAEGFRTFALQNDVKSAAEIDDGGDPELLELREACRGGLRAAEKRFANFSGVRKPSDGNFLREGGQRNRRAFRNARRRGLRGGPESGKHTNESEYAKGKQRSRMGRTAHVYG